MAIAGLEIERDLVSAPFPFDLQAAFNFHLDLGVPNGSDTNRPL